VSEPRRLPQRTPDEELLAVPRPGVPATLQTDATRIARMTGELAMGFAALAEVDRGVAVFGSARTPETDPEYALARDVGRQLGDSGFAIITGGGGGCMAAANRGAHDAGALSIGLSIDLPFEEHENQWIDLPLNFHYFFTRKVMFVRYSLAFVALPGGFGTLDELFECLTLIQTRKIHHFPIVLVDRDYWTPLVDWLRDKVLAEGKISPPDLDIFQVVDRPEEVVAAVQAAAVQQRRRSR
jgi:uncharacterized protein (TIGR00730 family)